MCEESQIQGKRITVVGAGVSGRALAELAAKLGAKVFVSDAKELPEETKKLFESAGIDYECGGNTERALEADEVVVSSGISPKAPIVAEALKRGMRVTGELDFVNPYLSGIVIGVTGSNGKTTTTSMIGYFLEKLGYSVMTGGNIGNAVAHAAGRDYDFIVLELSSFQLISMRRSPNVAVITNLSPNHLDVHKDMDEYVNAKKNVLLHQNAFGRTVLNADNALTAACAADTRGMTYMFSRREKTNGAWCSADGKIYFGDEYIMEESDIRIPGKHNVENYLAAISAVWGDVSKEVIRTVAKEFNGVEHRMEFVRELDGVRWYNDSIATSPSRAMIGTLSLYDFKIVMIAGGADKKVPFDELGKVICDKVKTLVLLAPEKPLEGFKTPAAGKIEAAVRGAENYKDGAPVILHANNMKDAVRLARESAEPGDVVSLCPAATGFDMYKSFAVRGDIYREEVKALK